MFFRFRGGPLPLQSNYLQLNDPGQKAKTCDKYCQRIEERQNKTRNLYQPFSRRYQGVEVMENINSKMRSSLALPLLGLARNGQSCHQAIVAEYMLLSPFVRKTRERLDGLTGLH